MTITYLKTSKINYPRNFQFLHYSTPKLHINFQLEIPSMTHLIPNSIKSSSTDLKKRAKMSHRLLKRLETWVTTFFMILYRLVAFLNISVKGILKILKKSYVSILQSGYIFKKIKQKSKMPLKLCRITKFQAVWMTGCAWKRRWLCAIYCWSLGNFRKNSVFMLKISQNR